MAVLRVKHNLPVASLEVQFAEALCCAKLIQYLISTWQGVRVLTCNVVQWPEVNAYPWSAVFLLHNDRVEPQALLEG